MPIRKANAKWNGNLVDGKGNMTVESGIFDSAFSFNTRFGDKKGTNPEELIGAAIAGCFSMALSHELDQAGFEPKSVETTAHVTIAKVGDGFEINKIKLDNTTDVNAGNDKFMEIANAAKENCPVSVALKNVEITLDAKLK